MKSITDTLTRIFQNIMTPVPTHDL